MEPVTHALASLALGRAAPGRITPRATPMLLISGLAADLDWISYTAGAPAFLQWHRTTSHSLLAGAAISAVVAATAIEGELSMIQRKSTFTARAVPAPSSSATTSAATTRAPLDPVMAFIVLLLPAAAWRGRAYR